MTLKHMKSERAAIAASLVASRHPSNDVSMLVLDDLSRARTRTALDEHDARISELQADIERVEESLRVAARDRQVADRLANRSDEKRRVDVQRQERRDEDEVAIRSFEGEPED